MKSYGASPRTILVVEDEPAISEVCQRVLKAEGFEVEIAVNGKVAQDMLRDREYDLFLIDIRTPVMNGRQLFQHMKENYPVLVSRVIFTTGDVMSLETKQSAELTSRPLLPKPFTPDELRAVIREALIRLEGD